MRRGGGRGGVGGGGEGAQPPGPGNTGLFIRTQGFYENKFRYPAVIGYIAGRD